MCYAGIAHAQRLFTASYLWFVQNMSCKNLSKQILYVVHEESNSFNIKKEKWYFFLKREIRYNPLNKCFPNGWQYCPKSTQANMNPLLFFLGSTPPLLTCCGLQGQCFSPHSCSLPCLSGHRTQHLFSVFWNVPPPVVSFADTCPVLTSGALRTPQSILPAKPQLVSLFSGLCFIHNIGLLTEVCNVCCSGLHVFRRNLMLVYMYLNHNFAYCELKMLNNNQAPALWWFILIVCLIGLRNA